MADRLTIKDIARELKIHHSTVSRALRNDSRVNKETQHKVIEYAQTHGYQTNLSALELRGEKKKAISILVPNIDHEFFSNFISRVTDLANNDGYVVTIYQSNEKVKREKQIIDNIIQNNAIGVIASLSMETKTWKHLSKMKKYGIPLVLFDRVSDEINVPKITLSHSEVVEEVVNKLIGRGYKKIAHITGTQSVSVFRENQKGYLRALQLSELEYCKTIIIEKGFTIEDGRQETEKLLNSEDAPDAIVSDSANLTFGVIKALRDKSQNFLDNFGLASFGADSSSVNSNVIRILSPKIIRIIQPKEIAETAYKVLLSNINGESENMVQSYTISAKIEE